MSSYYAYQHAKNHESVAVAQDENLDKKGCQLCEEGSKSAKEGECKFCAKDALVEALEEKEKEVSPNGEAEGTLVAVKDAGMSLEDIIAHKGTSEFKKEDHPRVGAGSEKGGQFVTSNKTIEKQDDLSKEDDKSENPDWEKEYKMWTWGTKEGRKFADDVLKIAHIRDMVENTAKESVYSALKDVEKQLRQYNLDYGHEDIIKGRMMDAIEEVQEEINKLKEEGIKECNQAEETAKKTRKMPDLKTIKPAILQPQTMKKIIADALDRYRIGKNDFNSDGLWMSYGEKPKHLPNY